MPAPIRGKENMEQEMATSFFAPGESLEVKKIKLGKDYDLQYGLV